ncbi:MAG: helix-turn-helix domain-containing protein [Micromonosporaceae bacterium]|nr:helix-turn-helix domain-containing protein [Micromonosporaceae bacterium]
MTTSPLDRAADAFAVELAQWRTQRGLSKKQLAAQMGFDPSYVSHVEGRRHRPTEDFARRAEAVLDAGGAIWSRFSAYDQLRRQGRVPSTMAGRDPAGAPQAATVAGITVADEVGTLSYLDGAYQCRVYQEIYNAGPEPVNRYPVRITVDRDPADPVGSNRYHREHPLTWEELGLRAVCGRPPAEPMRWQPIQDRDSFKEIWLHFENDQRAFPLYHGERTAIEYSYRVPEQTQGRSFLRTVRLPTQRLTIRLELPAARRPAVWGTEASLSAAPAPVRTPVDRRVTGDRTTFEWTTAHPPLHGRYRLEWRFETDPVR